jgi:hypothetical protein
LRAAIVGCAGGSGQACPANRAHPNSFSFGNPFLITRDQIITPPRPRTIALRLSARF